MKPLDRSVGVALAAAALAGLGWASQATLPAHRSDRGVLRLAWSVLPERIEECRQRSPEELERLPQHMRQPIVCEGTSATYRLLARIDGATVVDRVVHGGGLRRDRRLYVHEELPVHSGELSVEVRFDRVEPDRPPDHVSSGATPTTAGAASEPRAEQVPPHLAFKRRLQLPPREAILVTYSAAEQTLIAVQSHPDAVR
jgi:hypothetical protein